MHFKKIKKVLVQVLMLTILIPNISVNAEGNDSDIKVQEEVSVEILNDEKVVEDNLNEITEDNKATDTKVEDKGVTDKVETEAEVETKVETEVEVKEDTKKSSVVDTEVIEGSLVGEEYKSKKNDEVYVDSIRTFSEDSLDSEQYKQKLESLEEVTILETKTEAAYEIALAHEDGTFTYVSSVESIDEAINEVEELSEELEKDPEGTVNKLTNMSSRKSSAKLTSLNTTTSSSSTLPTVISSSGQVVYSTNAMARIIKYIDGKVYAGDKINTMLYANSNLTGNAGYINQVAVDDVPILEDAGNSAKIMVSGQEAWINKNTKSSEYDMKVVPLNQVKNPSYYRVENGLLIHFISSNLEGSSGWPITIGTAPSYLKAGVRYFSYDGLYFYDGQDIQNGLNTLINDYKSGSRGNSVNANNPYYLYYNYLPFRSKTVYTAAELNQAIAAHTSDKSKLRNLGSALKDAEQKYGVNALLALSVAINESAWGMSKIALDWNNLFGMNAVDSNTDLAYRYDSPGASVVEFAKNFVSAGYSYVGDWRYNGGFLGNKKNGVNYRYASDPYWGEKAAQHATTLDRYLSATLNNKNLSDLKTSDLLDTDFYQLGIATSNNKVMLSNGTLLYNITNDKNQYTSYFDIPFVISKTTKVTVSGQSTYEINPEMNKPLTFTNGVPNKVSGEYDWTIKGYVLASGVKFINQGTGGNLVLPSLAVRGGANRYETAVEISKSRFSTADTVVLVNGFALVDGLAATPLASYHTGPILLTQTNALGSATKAEINRLKAKKIIIVGGTGIITSKVINELKAMGISSSNITRLGGSNRYDTALEVAKYIDKNLYNVSNVVIASGYGEADAMSIAPVSGRDRMPIILVQKDNIPASVNTWLASKKLESAYIIGGTGVVSSSVMSEMNKITSNSISSNRLGGSTRYETNAQIIERFYPEQVHTVIIAKGVQLVDALTVGSVAALNNYPVVISGADLVAEQKYVLGKRTATRVYQAGYGVSTTAIKTLRESLAYYKR